MNPVDPLTELSHFILINVKVNGTEPICDYKKLPLINIKQKNTKLNE